VDYPFNKHGASWAVRSSRVNGKLGRLVVTDSLTHTSVQALLETEGVQLTFTNEALHTIARVAEEANRLMDNIGVNSGNAFISCVSLECLLG
jgi:ATP-dependent protease HslVU (ClpYQ) ATPase subunit